MNRIDWEKRTVRHMIELWCRKNHGEQACREMGSRGGGLVSQGGSGEGSHGGSGQGGYGGDGQSASGQCLSGEVGHGSMSHGGGGQRRHGGQGSHECQVGHGGPGLCGECRELLEYSLARLEHCKFGNAKTKCHKCPVHCYRPDMREKIRTVMRFSGPRMLLYHPLEALRYLFSR